MRFGAFLLAVLAVSGGCQARKLLEEVGDQVGLLG